MIAFIYKIICNTESFSRDMLDNFNDEVQKKSRRWQNKDPIFISKFIPVEKSNDTVTLSANILYNDEETGKKRLKEIEKLFSKYADGDWNTKDVSTDQA